MEPAATATAVASRRTVCARLRSRRRWAIRIRIDDVGKTYGATKALTGVSTEIEPGTLVALIGLNGAGKTTLLNCLGGLVIPACGGIWFDDEPLERSRVDLRRRLMYLPDRPPFLAEMTVLRHITTVLSLYGRSNLELAPRVEALLEALDLLPLIDKRMGLVSRGQAYKASLLCMLALDPEVWLLDEPFASGTDAVGLRVFKDHALGAVRRGRTIIYTTQIVEVAESFSDRWWVLNEGRLDYDGPPTTESEGALDGLLHRLRGGSRA